jgi:hypothetical protein
LNPNFLLVHRNRYLEGMDDGQKTPRGHPDFISYVKILRVFITNGQTDGQTDGEISSGVSWVTTPAARGLEKYFSAVLERFLEPIHALRVYFGNTRKQ